MKRAYFYVNGKPVSVELPKPQPIQERTGWYEFVENLPTWALIAFVFVVLVVWGIWKVVA